MLNGKVNPFEALVEGEELIGVERLTRAIAFAVEAIFWQLILFGPYFGLVAGHELNRLSRDDPSNTSKKMFTEVV